MHVVIALTYGLTIWMASVIYAVIAAPKWTGIAIAIAPVVISGCMIALLALDWVVNCISKAIMASLASLMRTGKEKRP